MDTRITDQLPPETENLITLHLNKDIIGAIIEYLSPQELTNFAKTNKQVFTLIANALNIKTDLKNNYFNFLSDEILGNRQQINTFFNNYFSNLALTNAVTAENSLHHLLKADDKNFNKLIAKVDSLLTESKYSTGLKEEVIISDKLWYWTIVTLCALAYIGVESWLVTEAFVNKENHLIRTDIPINDTICSRPEAVKNETTGTCHVSFGKYGDIAFIVGLTGPVGVFILAALLCLCYGTDLTRTVKITMPQNKWLPIKEEIDGLLKRLLQMHQQDKTKTDKILGEKTIKILSAISKKFNKKTLTELEVTSLLEILKKELTVMRDKVQLTKNPLSFYHKPINDFSMQIEDKATVRNKKCASVFSCFKKK